MSNPWFGSQTAFWRRNSGHPSSNSFKFIAPVEPPPTITAPGIPVLSLSQARYDQIAASWVDGSGGTPTGWVVQWRASNQAYSTDRQRTLTGRSTTITGLSYGVLYYVRVYATNSAGNSGWHEQTITLHVVVSLSAWPGDQSLLITDYDILLGGPVVPSNVYVDVRYKRSTQSSYTTIQALYGTYVFYREITGLGNSVSHDVEYRTRVGAYSSDWITTLNGVQTTDSDSDIPDLTLNTSDITISQTAPNSYNVSFSFTWTNPSGRLGDYYIYDASVSFLSNGSVIKATAGTGHASNTSVLAVQNVSIAPGTTVVVYIVLFAVNRRQTSDSTGPAYESIEATTTYTAT